MIYTAKDLAILARAGFSDVSIREDGGIFPWLESLDSSYESISEADRPSALRKLLWFAFDQQVDSPRYLDESVMEILVGSRGDAGKRRQGRAQTVMEGLKKRYDVQQRRVEQIIVREICPILLQAVKSKIANPNAIQSDDWADCTTYISVWPVPGQMSRYWLRMRLEFSSTEFAPITVVTDAEERADAICENNPQILEVSVPSRGMSANQFLSYKVSDTDPFTEAPKREMGVEEVSEVLGLDPKQEDKYFLYEFETDLPKGHSLRYRLVLDQELSTSSYFFWSAPRRCFVKTIEIDLSGFPDAHNRQFYIIPRMGYGTVVEENHDMLLFKISCNRWVSPGQNISVNWGPKK